MDTAEGLRTHLVVVNILWHTLVIKIDIPVAISTLICMILFWLHQLLQISNAALDRQVLRRPMVVAPE